MINRFGLFLRTRGSATYSPSRKYKTLGRPSRVFSSGYHGYSESPRGFVYCAVGGLIAFTSVVVKGNIEEDMAPLELPGRPGNLTDEQKTKLKEMWSTAFKVFGIPLSSESDAGDAESVNELPRTNTDVSTTPTTTSEGKDKKGKTLTSMFKKKKDRESASSSGTSSTTSLPHDVSRLSVSDGDDKYSQTKEFKEALATSSPQEIHDAFWRMVKADHPDALFLRFLRARKWDVGKAMVMLVATMRWRSKQLDVLPFPWYGLMVG